MKIVVAVTAASGALYARLCLEQLLRAEEVSEIALVYSAHAREVADFEGVTLPEDPRIRIFDNDDLFAPPASGSADYDAMAVVPCSVGTLGRIACGISQSLIERAADVMLKERRRLVLVVRETPLSLIHLRNMTALTEAGAVVLPASPGFYARPSSIEELCRSVTERVTALLGISGPRYRWTGEGRSAGRNDSDSENKPTLPDLRRFFVTLPPRKIVNKNIPMATTADIKIGMCIELDGKTFQIVDFQHVKPGKGPAFVRTKLKNLENGRVLENTFSAGAKIEPVRVERRPYQFTYEDDLGAHFMHTETFEEINIDKNLIDNYDLMADGQIVEVMFHTEKESVLSAELPPIVDMEVTYTEPGIKGDTASTNSLKPATVNTGATIKVPLFINTGDKIRVDTRTREYYERIK